jgi:hypothetical protein
MFLPTLVSKGQVIGTWKQSFRRKAVSLTAAPFVSLSAAQQRSFAQPTQRYGRFLGLASSLERSVEEGQAAG